MECPYCQSDSTVLDSRTTTEGIRRRRKCGKCSRRFTTYEKAGSPSLRVTKRSGQTEPFDRRKLHTCLARVCRHRPSITTEDVSRLTRDIEAQLVDAAAKSVTSGKLAALAIDKLKLVDSIASQRLAVNYINENGELNTEPTDESDRSQLGLF